MGSSVYLYYKSIDGCCSSANVLSECLSLHCYFRRCTGINVVCWCIFLLFKNSFVLIKIFKGCNKPLGLTALHPIQGCGAIAPTQLIRAEWTLKTNTHKHNTNTIHNKYNNKKGDSLHRRRERTAGLIFRTRMNTRERELVHGRKERERVRTGWFICIKGPELISFIKYQQKSM